MLEELVLILHVNGKRSELREWVHNRLGDNDFGTRKAVFVPYAGYPSSHQWYFNRDESDHTYEAGDYIIEVVDVSRVAGRNNDRTLFRLKFSLGVQEIKEAHEKIADSDEETEKGGFIELDWNYRSGCYDIIPIRRRRPKPPLPI